MKHRKTILRVSLSQRKAKYCKLIDAGYESNPKKEKERLEAEGYVKDHSLSTKKDKVYYSPLDKKAYVVYKGTNPLDVRDVATDAALAVGLGRFTPRFKRAKRIAKQAANKYGSEHTIAVGHSLGGSLATESGLAHRVTFNKGVGIGGIGKQMQRGQEDYRTSHDLVSSLSTFSKYKNKSGTSSGSSQHTIRSSPLSNPLSAHAVSQLQ